MTTLTAARVEFKLITRREEAPPPRSGHTDKFILTVVQKGLRGKLGLMCWSTDWRSTDARQIHVAVKLGGWAGQWSLPRRWRL